MWLKRKYCRRPTVIKNRLVWYKYFFAFFKVEHRFIKYRIRRCVYFNIFFLYVLCPANWLRLRHSFDFFWMMIDIFYFEICIEIWTEKGRHLHSLDLFDFLFGHKFSLNIFNSNFGLDKSDFLSHKNKLSTHLNSQKNSRCL